MAYSQQDARWKNIKLGNSAWTIGDSGCLLTAMCNVAGQYGHAIDPPTLNQEFKNRKIDAANLKGSDLSTVYPDIQYRGFTAFNTKVDYELLRVNVKPGVEGIIKLDGVDIRQIDLNHLRKNVGVVLQDSFLFRGTIRENIAASNPGATAHEVVAAARLAGAEEFIDQLPMAYESMLEEGATNLSGGQRQRIAIARALLPQPKFLIFDEATSALDPESESIIQQNLAEIARGRSMIIVSHRLSSLVNSDSILVLNQGRIVDFAPHVDLLQRCEIYSHLWQQQTRTLIG